ncbi:MAG: molybdate ABC transporter substrate-binding protein [Rhodospirillaceae bacterium]|nr:molybdate ABC transporter substrate-binding protein [Rhodospirillaceae bacterium]MBT6511399.1 molybdate ABC transporter substrate-binding protein [Rhodospirillaceae bacterium]MBT7614925.1 molybdate ABC transporter substrate-binding protein [Rhodospirillaceae bacterium]
MIHRAVRVVLVTFLGLISGQIALSDEDPLVVFAAASTTEAVSAAAEVFTSQTGIKVVISFASSSSLAKQIEHGAPAGVHISANPAWMQYLEERGLLASGSQRLVAANQLVLATSSENPPETGSDVAETLFIALGDDDRLAVGDPAHVPAGLYARQMLEALGLWAELEPRLARAADVRGALALVERGEAPVGIVYLTDLSVSERVTVLELVPADLHEPILYPAAVVAAGDRPEARAFLEFLVGPMGRQAFTDNGFLPPP